MDSGKERNIQRIAPLNQLGTGYQWAWKDFLGYQKYQDPINQEINQQFQKKVLKFQFTIGQTNYEIDLEQMIQKNCTTNFIRQILRAQQEIPVGVLVIKGQNDKIKSFLSHIEDLKLKLNIEIIDYDKAFNIAQQFKVFITFNKEGIVFQGYKDDVQRACSELFKVNNQLAQSQMITSGYQIYPAYWDLPFQGFYQESDLNQNSREFQESVALMKKTAPNVDIQKINIIQNKILYKKFKSEVNALKEIYGKEPEIKRLFHGTGNCQPIVISQSEIGFDDKYSLDYCIYGKGIYFATNASYSYQDYAYIQGKKHQMFLCDVIVGETIKVAGKVQHPPDNPKYSQLKKRYDSVNDGNGMYIVFENGRAYPVFLITYEVI